MNKGIKLLCNVIQFGTEKKEEVSDVSGEKQVWESI